MPPQVQTSFIPKKPTVAQAPSTGSGGSHFNILGFLSFTIFFASMVAAGGFYLYKSSLEGQIENMGASLERAKASFEPSTIQTLEELDKRLNASRSVLSKHISISPLFQSLQALTLKSVRFSKFSFDSTVATQAAVGKAGSSLKVSMSGQTSSAGGYRSIALQSDKLSENKYIKDIVFSNLTLTQSGGVSFDLEFSVDPEFLYYEKIINQQEATSLE